MPLPLDSRLQVQITGDDTASGAVELDPIALLLDENGLVSADADFVFYGQTVHPSGAAALTEAPGAPNQLILAVEGLPEQTQRVRVGVQARQHALATGSCSLEVLDLQTERILVQATLPPAGPIGSTVLVELLNLVRQGDEWSLEVAVEPLDMDLAELACAAGVAVE